MKDKMRKRIINAGAANSTHQSWFVAMLLLAIACSISMTARGDQDQPGHYRQTNLVADDTNNATDVFVYDRQARTTTRVSVASNGTPADQISYSPTISGDHHQAETAQQRERMSAAPNRCVGFITIPRLQRS